MIRWLSLNVACTQWQKSYISPVLLKWVQNLYCLQAILSCKHEDSFIHNLAKIFRIWCGKKKSIPRLSKQNSNDKDLSMVGVWGIWEVAI